MLTTQASLSIAGDGRIMIMLTDTAKKQWRLLLGDCRCHLYGYFCKASQGTVCYVCILSQALTHTNRDEALG